MVTPQMISQQAGYEQACLLAPRDMSSVRKPLSPYMCFLKEQKHLIYQQHGSISMKEFVRYASKQWHVLTDDEKMPYQLMGEVEKTRYERDKQSFVTGGV